MKYVILSIVIYTLYTLGLTRPVEVGFSYIFAPTQQHLVLQAKQVKELGYFFQDMWLLRASYNDLYDKYTQATIAASKSVLYEKENVILKQQLDNKTNESLTRYRTAIANVYPNEGDLSATTRLLDLGTKVGVRVGDPVLYNSSLVGLINSTSAAKSKMLLLTSPQAKIPAFVQKDDIRIEGIVTGQYGTTVALTRLLPEDRVTVGDFVYTSNRSSAIPQGLFLGKVVKVEINKASAEKIAYIENPINIAKLYKVFVVID